jgi:two-component system, OmpR family, copper resistance phosphate regulon response regulator CusR
LLCGGNRYTGGAHEKEYIMRMLVVDASDHSAEVVERALRELGYAVDRSRTASEMRQMALALDYNVIIVDPALPDANGLVVCSALRHQDLRTPILVISDNPQSQHVLDAFDSGADDFVSRQAQTAEVLARVQALLRRGLGLTATLTFADLKLDCLRRTAERAGVALDLRSKEFTLLELFMRRSERVLTRSLIAEQIWDIRLAADSNLIEVYISNLRKKLGDPPLIETVAGTGYMLTENARERRRTPRHLPQSAQAASPNGGRRRPPG